MKILGKKKPQKAGLYQGYLQEQELLRLEEERRRREEEAARLEERAGRQDVFVCSLTHGCGTTYISAAIADYFARRKKQTVLISNDDKYVEDILVEGVTLCRREELESANTARCIVQDGGVFGECSRTQQLSMGRASTVIIVSHADDGAMRKLADFVELRGESALTYIYMFNVMPKEWEKKVKHSMSDFYYCCLPLFYAPSPDTGVSAVFDRIFGKRGGGK